MLERKDLEFRYRLFEHYALNDQRTYYQTTIERHRSAARHVNRLRAIFALLTGLAAAVAGLIVQAMFVNNLPCSAETLAQLDAVPSNCLALQFVVGICIVLCVAMPAFGAFFSTLADLYQWDRMIEIYDVALENIEVADARSPLPDMDDISYRASVRAFAEGTLQVMQDETAQWGQSIRTPSSLDKFIAEEREKAARLGGDADAAKQD